MTRPSEVLIGPYRYPVVFAADPALTLQPNWGNISHDPHRIDVMARADEMRQRAILLHELLHGIDEQIVIGLSEKQVLKLAPALLELLRRNPLLVGWLMEEPDVQF